MQVSETGRIVLRDLFNFTDRIDTITWEQFRPGVKIHRLYGNQRTGPSAALLLYEPGAGIPLHEHLGYEHLFILAESQHDETGESAPGTLVINPPGSAHSVVVPNGGLILAIWEKPVLFREP